MKKIPIVSSEPTSSRIVIQMRGRAQHLTSSRNMKERKMAVKRDTTRTAHPSLRSNAHCSKELKFNSTYKFEEAGRQ